MVAMFGSLYNSKIILVTVQETAIMNSEIYSFMLKFFTSRYLEIKKKGNKKKSSSCDNVMIMDKIGAKNLKNSL